MSVKLFEPFNQALAAGRARAISTSVTKKILMTPANAAHDAGRSRRRSKCQAPDGLNACAGSGKGDLASVYDTALTIMNAQASGSEDTRIVERRDQRRAGHRSIRIPRYMDAKAFRDMQTQTRGAFGGLGIEVTMEDGLLKVVSPIDDAPADKAGILANDVIVSIDDQPVQGLTLNRGGRRRCAVR